MLRFQVVLVNETRSLIITCKLTASGLREARIVILFRKIVFYIFLLLYLVTCPLLLLYAFGFIVKPGAEYGLVKTGLIYLSTAPSDARVYLGSSRYSKKTPVMIRDLTPGTYTLRVSHEGYQTWEQTIPVEAEKASVLDYVLLLPDQWETHEFSDQPFDELRVGEGSGQGLLRRGELAEGLMTFDLKTESLKSLFEASSPLAGARVKKIFFGKESTLILLHLELNEAVSFIVVDLAHPEKTPRDITFLFSRLPDEVFWEKGQLEYFFSFQDGVVDRLNIQDHEVKPAILKNLRGLAIHEGNLYGIRHDGLVIRTDRNGKDETFLLDDPVLARSLFGTEGRYKIWARDSGLTVFIGSKGELISNRLPYRMVEAGVLGVDYFKKNRKLLIWLKNRIGVIDFQKEKTSESGMFEKGTSLNWIYREGSNIVQAFWVYEGSHVLFREGDRVRLIDTETYDAPRVDEVIEVNPGSAIHYEEETGYLYYLERDSGHLKALEILPKKAVISLPFPDRNEATKVREKNNREV